MTEATKLEISFTPKQISYLAHTSCKSFIHDQYERFEFDDSDENVNYMGFPVLGWLHWLENDSYLSALIMQQFCIARGCRASILTDEHRGEWVVWTDDPLDMEEPSQKSTNQKEDMNVTT